MSKPKKHHDILIDMAVKDGWIRGHNWRPELHRVGCARGYDELAILEESFSSALPRPDAWRIVIADTGRRYSTVILEFLEVEVTGGITETKDEWYRYLWDIFDASSYFHLNIWHMDRFGVIRPYITNSSLYDMEFGMNANWRAGNDFLEDEDEDEGF